MDAEIAALEQRRDKTRAIKQGMMQQLLTGRTRLSECTSHLDEYAVNRGFAQMTLINADWDTWCLVRFLSESGFTGFVAAHR